MKTIIPAIDISAGQCIRLVQGNFEEKKIYDADPVETAMQFAELGARRLHVVDLDAAFGKGNNRGVIGQIIHELKGSNCIIEVGGGLRTESDVKAALAMGADRLSIGTVLINDFFEVQRWVHKFGKVFVASLDEKDGFIQVSGWLQDSNVSVESLLHQIKKLELCSIAYTNIKKDGMFTGVDIERGNTIAQQSHVPVILSGGIGSMDDIEHFMNDGHENVCALIVGKAIYDGKINIKEVFEKFPSPSSANW